MTGFDGEETGPYVRRWRGPFRPATVLVVLAIAALLAASCAADPDSDAAGATGDAALSADGGAGDGADESGSDRGTDDPPVAGLAYDAGELSPTSSQRRTTTTDDDTTTDETSSATSTTSGSGGGPVTTVGSGGGGDVSIYQGVIGTLTRDQLITPPIAPAPVAAPGTHPLTGLPGTAAARPAAVAKIDNSSRARPQSGLNDADLVVEEEVEGGVTRFAAIFHSTSSVVGPVRSGRTTDIGVINGLGSPLLLYSGANTVTDALLRAQPTVQNRNAGTSSGYWRNTSRKAPSNLYTDTGPHWASASGGPPPAQFAYRADGAPVPGTPDDALTVAYRASSAAWTWDGTAWLRSQGGAAHLTDGGARVSAANVVVIEAREVATGMVDSSGATVPEFVFVGNGRATVFTAGMRIEGTWTRSTLASVATLTTAEGAVIELTPGRTWIELIRADAGMLR